MKQKKFSSASRISSFGFAINGIRKFFRDEPNARIHLLLTVMVFILAAYLKVSGVELSLLIIVSAIVWVAEIFNTAIEHIMDFISPAHDPKVETIKDVSAAAVLIAAIVAAAVGLVVFIPKII